MFGPQTGYFSPQMLMLQELQGPGISARGAAFAGLNLYVLLGRGQDYAWSATSAPGPHRHVRGGRCAHRRQRPDGGPDRYLYHGQCLAMEALEQRNSWRPTTADPTPAGSYRLLALRTKYGLVTSAARSAAADGVHQLRSTYRHEADSAIGFQAFNDPS